jgi:hypothetical protein
MIKKKPVKAIRIFLPIEEVNNCFQVINERVNKISDRQMYYRNFKFFDDKFFAR